MVYVYSVLCDEWRFRWEISGTLFDCWMILWMAPDCFTETRGRWLTLLLVGYHVRYLERPVTVDTDEIKTAKITNCILVYLIFNKKIFLEVNYKLCILIDMVHRLGLVTVIGLKMKGLEQRNPVHRAPISNNTDKRGLIYVGI